MLRLVYLSVLIYGWILSPQIQTRIGNQLTSLEIRWTELISSVLQIEMANVALYAEVERLDKKEAELASL